MGLLKVTEFAEKYNLNRTNIYTYSKRSKLIITEGYIDESNPINKIFIESRETSAKVKVRPSADKEHVTVIPREQSADELETTKETKERTKRITRAVSDPLYLEFQKTNNLRDEKLHEEIRLARIRNDKTEGRLLPTDLIKQSVGELISRYKMSFLQQTEQLLRDILNEVQATNDQITSSCSKLTDIANNSSKQAVTETKAVIQNIINESK
jgi:hypothetical protein